MTEIAAHSAQSSAVDPGQELLRWRSHPVRNGGWRLVFVVAMLIALPMGLVFLYGPFYGLLTILIMGGSLGTYFLPTDYVFYGGGVETRFIGVTRRFTWEQFRSYYDDRNGILLSPFDKPSRLENFRGVFLRYDQNHDAVIDIVRRNVSAIPAAPKAS